MKFAGYFTIVAGFLILSIMGCEKEPIDHLCDHIITDTIYDTIYVDPAIPSPITFNEHVAAITNDYCVSCHGGSSPSAGFALTNYNQVKDAAENKPLIDRINDAADPMPQSGLMSAANRSLIERWVNDGYLEN